VHSGLFTRPLPGYAGRITPEQVRNAMTFPESGHEPITKIVCVENTHNMAGGRVWPLEDISALEETVRELGLRFHLDGARVLNAAVALSVPPAQISSRFDTVTLCLSKGLGCPLGAVVAGSAALMKKARRAKHLFGGAMRQAGIVAAAGVYALEHHVERLTEDHARARRLAEGLAAAGLPVDVEATETNFVQLDTAPLGLTQPVALERLRQAGVGMSWTIGTKLRAVTHLDVSDEDIERAIELMPRALGVLVRA
jgi:threonine aldolase